MSYTPEWLPRFLNPRHAAYEYAIIHWHGIGEADTPGADARCRILLTRAHADIATAAFAAFGPPVVVACADWACERLSGRTIAAAHGLSAGDIERALALAPQQRYAALLVRDALANALRNLQQ